MKGQLFTTDFLASVLVITVALGLFVHSLDFSVRAFPDSSSLAPQVSSALLAQLRGVALVPARMEQSATDCDGKAPLGSKAWCYVLLPSDGPLDTRYADSNAMANGSLSVLYENGHPLGPAHADFGTVQTVGAGSFTDWFDSTSRQSFVVFSSSDGSSPVQNGKSYVLDYIVIPNGLDPGSGAFCVSESVAGTPARTVQDNCANVDACPVRSSADRWVACGQDRCTFSVRVCGGAGP